MNNKTSCILRYLFVVLLGLILFFAFDLSGGNLIVVFTLAPPTLGFFIPFAG